MAIHLFNVYHIKLFKNENEIIVIQIRNLFFFRRLATLPPAMRFRQLKETSKASVGVYRSHIHGRGLFCKRDIEEGKLYIANS